MQGDFFCIEALRPILHGSCYVRVLNVDFFFLFIETFSLSPPLFWRNSSHIAVITILSKTPYPLGKMRG